MWIVKLKGGPTATMQDGKWSSKDPLLERHLNTIFTPDRILEGAYSPDPEADAARAMVRSFGDLVEVVTEPERGSATTTDGMVF